MKRLIGVGVGPGDPELVTVKAVRVLREADVVLVPVLAAPDPGLPGPGQPGPAVAESPGPGRSGPAGPRGFGNRKSGLAGSRESRVGGGQHGDQHHVGLA